MLSSRNISGHGIGRPRSGTLEDREPQATPARPSHIRSRSYHSSLSPNDSRLQKESTFQTDGKASISNGKDGTGDGRPAEQAASSSAAQLIPKIHLPGRHKASQDLRGGSVGPTDGEQGQSRHSSQLQLQHLGLHLPVNVKRTSSHRHTRSEIPRGSMADDKTVNGGLLHPNVAQIRGENMLTRMASNLSSMAGGPDAKQGHHKPHHKHSSSDISRLTTNATDHLTHSRPGLRRRATSDPRAPQYPFRHTGTGGMAAAQAQFGVNPHLEGIPGSPAPKPMTEVEVLFYKAEKAKRDRERNVKEADVQRLTTQIAESNVELQNQLASADTSARGMMRRLDYAHDTLTRTCTSLVDTISSFQNLCEQSDKLIKNFDTRTTRLDKDMRATLSKHRKALLDSRGKKIAVLEERSKAATEKAEEMSRRLENCRTMVKNFTEREHTKRKAWKGVIIGSIWGFAFILLGILLGLGLWWYKSFGNIAKHDIQSALTMVLNKDYSHHVQIHDSIKGYSKQHEEALRNVPSDVRDLLNDIAQRHDGTEPDRMAPGGSMTVEESASSSSTEDKRLENLFSRLEL